MLVSDLIVCRSLLRGAEADGVLSSAAPVYSELVLMTRGGSEAKSIGVIELLALMDGSRSG